MLKTRGRKILRDVLSRRTRLVLVTTSIFIGVLSLVILTTMGQLLTQQLQHDLKSSEMAMLRIYLNIPLNSDRAAAADLSVLDDLPNVERVEGQAVYRFQWKSPTAAKFQQGQLFAYSEPFHQIKLEPIRLEAGRYPREKQGEIAIEQRMADQHDLQIGDSLDIQINGGQVETWEIVGLVFQPYFYIGNSKPTSNVYANYVDAQHIVGFAGYSSIYVRFDNFNAARQQSATFRRTLSRETSYRIVFHLLDDPEQNTFLVGVRRFSRALMLLAVIAMIVASFLVTNVISAILIEQRRQIGAMKAIGATSWDIFRIYIGLVLVYGLIGTIPALIAGLIIGEWAAQQAAPLANTILRNPSPPMSAIGLGLVLGLGIPTLAAFLPTYTASRVTILEAMSDWGIRAHYGHGFFPRLIRRIPMPITIEHAVNTIMQQRTRLALTILSLTLAATAFMGVFAIFYNLNGVIGNIREVLRREISLDPSEIEVVNVVQSLIMAEEDQIRTIQPGVTIELQVETVSVEHDLETSTTTDNIFVTGIDPQTDVLELSWLEGDGWIDNPMRPGIVISPEMAEAFEKSVGDFLILVSPNNRANFEIIGIAVFPLEMAFMEWQHLANFVGEINDAPIPNAYWEQVEIDSEGQAVWAIGIDEQVGSYLYPEFDPAANTAIISRDLAEANGYQIGQVIEIDSIDGDILSLDETPTFTIVAIVDASIQQIRLLTSDMPDELQTAEQFEVVALYWSTLAEVTHLDYQDISPPTYYIDLANPVSPTLTSPNNPIVPTAVFNNQLAIADRISQTILSMGFVMNFASLLLAAVGGIGLLTITMIGVNERQRDIGVMRSIGATSGTIRLQFLLEGFFVGIVAWLVGVPASFYLSRVLINLVPFQEVITYHYTIVTPIIGFAGILVVTFIATIYPATLAARKTVSEILRYQ